MFWQAVSNCKLSFHLCCQKSFNLDVFLKSTEVDVELVEGCQEGAEGCACGHLGKGIDILGEALATIAKLAVGTGDIGMGVVDVAGEEHAGMYLAPVAAHLLTVLAAGVEIGDFIGTEDIVHILGQLGLQRGHDSELLADKDLGEEVVGTGEDHGLFLEVLDVGALGEELGHIAHLVACLAGEHVAGAGEDGGADEDGDVGEVLDELLHQREVLRAIILGGNMNLQEGDVDVAQVIVHALGRVADKDFAFRVVVFQPVFQGSTYEATTDNSNVDHNDFM